MKKLLVFAACLLCGSAAHALDASETFAKCGLMKDDKKRLSCYDSIRDAAVREYQTSLAANKGYTPMNFTDFKVDVKELSGRKIAVTALAQTIGDQMFLKSDEFDMNPVFATFDKLPREDRKKLASGCQMVLCKGKFYGVVRQTPIGTLGLALDKVEWQ